MVITQPEQLGEFELKALRSEILDAFADLESLICSFLKDARLSSKASHFGARVEAFKMIEGITRIAKANYSKRDRLAEDIAGLLPIRADIVHSRMRICVIDGFPAAIFVNSQNKSEAFPPRRILTADELGTMCSKILHIVAELGTLQRVSNPASSPPPPSPAAATAP